MASIKVSDTKSPRARKLAALRCEELRSMASVQSRVNVSIKSLEDFCVHILTGLGVSEADARTTSDVLVTTEAWGVATHGVKLLRGYARRLRGGGLRCDARPSI